MVHSILRDFLSQAVFVCCVREIFIYNSSRLESRGLIIFINRKSVRSVGKKERRFGAVGCGLVPNVFQEGW